MNIQIFGKNKCRETQKAVRFFKERGLNIHFVDITVKTITKGELRNIYQSVKPEELIDKDSREYKNKNLQYIDFDIEEELLNNQLLLKTPIIRIDNKSFAGFDVEKIKKQI